VAIEAPNVALHLRYRLVPQVTVKASDCVIQCLDESVFAASLCGFQFQGLEEAASDTLATKFLSYPQIAHE
jgi:hypothetical protein